MYFLKIVDIKHENGKWKIVRLNDPDLSIDPSAPAPAAAQQVETQAATAAIPAFSPAAQSPQYPAAPQEKQKLPGGLKAIGILNIIFGSLGILWNVVRIFLVLLYLSNLESTPRIGEPENWRWLLAGHSFSLLCAFALCVSGIGILRLANWGRILALAAVSARIAMGFWEMIDMFRLPPVETISPEQAFVINASKIFYLVITILTLIYPVIVLILLSRRSTRQYFQNKISI